MPSADLLKGLFRSFKQGNDERFYELAKQIISEEKKKNHNILARDLQIILDNGQSTNGGVLVAAEWGNLPKDRESGAPLLEVREPAKNLQDILLNSTLTYQIGRIIEEYLKREQLYTYKLKPKQKLLFAGPPGCGKTLATEVLAGELGLPILYTRFDSVVSSYLGETATNLRQIFNFATRGTWIVFFDEFDAIGKSREDVSEHGELKRVVNTFLQLLDNFKSESIFIAATNHENLLDRALWRRFDDILFFSPPLDEDIPDFIKLKLRNFPHTIEYKSYSDIMSGWSYADIERVCVEAIKISILLGSNTVNSDLFEKALHEHESRVNIISENVNNA